MQLIGLTGGIGMGKTTAVELLSGRNLPVVDTDVLAREVVEPGRPAAAEIRNAFGDGVFGSDGQLLRQELARVVFADPVKRRQLEAIVHPRIRAAWQAETENWRASGYAVGVVVIPLLFETNAGGLFDRTICVACTVASQRIRLRARGWDDQEINRRNAAQWPVPKKMEAADRVIWTEGEVELIAAQFDRILTA